MKPIKIVFFDIDGTLLKPGCSQPSPNVKHTLLRLREQGIRICLATGRSPAALPKFEGIEFDGWLTYNGSLCYTKTETVYSNPLAPETVQRLIANAAKLGRPVAVATAHRLAANGFDPDLADYYAIAKLRLTVAEDFAEAAREPVYQLLIGCREADHPALLQGAPDAKIVISWDRAVDVIPANSGKEAGVRSMLAHFGLTEENALAFGDGNNDIEMLQTVGTGVAMENASPQLKAAADTICGPVLGDGIYHYCLQKGLI